MAAIHAARTTDIGPLLMDDIDLGNRRLTIATYGTQVTKDTVSTITDSVLDEMTEGTVRWFT